MALPAARADREAPAADARAGPGRRAWLWLLLSGTAVWVAAAAITALTRDTILVPTVILVGSFLVPVSMVAFALSRSSGQRLTAEVMLLAFVAAGTLGVVFSALIETYLLSSAYGTFVGVGLVEEVCKGAVVVAAARLVPTRAPRDGMILGATVGAGFASFESAGYALTAVIGHADDHPVRLIVETEAFRALLAPFGHITWTALLGGAIFAAASAHGPSRRRAASSGRWSAWSHCTRPGMPPTDALLVVWGAIGAAWLVTRWRRYARAPAPRG